MEEQKKKLFTKRRFLKASLAGLGSCAGAVGYGFLIEPDLLAVNETDLYVQGLPAGMDGLKVMQLTDFHFEQDSDPKLLQKVVNRVNELKPDVVVYTGDYITRGMQSFEFLMEGLSSIQAKHGMYAVLGNHDGWHGNIAQMKRQFNQIGVGFLVNQNSRLHIGGESLVIAGTDFVWLGQPDLSSTFKGLRAQETCLALVHEPDYFDEVCKVREQFIQFSGHTHGGQCRVPLINYAPVKVKYGEKYIKGAFGNSQQQLFVSSGVGTTGIRVRFACLPELALITLKCKAI